MYGTNSDKGYKVNRMSLRIGIDIGSTTVKVVLLDEQNKLLFRSYERHYSKARERAAETLRSLADRLAGRQVRIVITGSAGLGVAKAAEIDFVQEVYATAAAVNQYIPDTDAVIELGGEDARLCRSGSVYQNDRSQEDPGNIPCGLRTDLSAADPIRRKRQPEPDREQAGEENRFLFLYNRPDRNASHKKHLYVYPADF